jgi:hypothetical protein
MKIKPKLSEYKKKIVLPKPEIKPTKKMMMKQNSLFLNILSIVFLFLFFYFLYGQYVEKNKTR